jgi:Peptidase family M28/PA domain
LEQLISTGAWATEVCRFRAAVRAFQPHLAIVHAALDERRGEWVTPRHFRPQRPRSWAAALCVAALAAVVAPTTGAIAADPCETQANDTPSKLVACIKTGDLWHHMQNFEAIAKANPSPADGHPSRNSGEPGYKASADYVASVMSAAGYNVTIQTYTFTYYAYTGIPSWSEASPVAQTFTLTTDWNPGQSLGSVSGATLQPAGGIIIPSPGGSTSGCSPSDFTGFVPGRIALIQRGTCFFGVKALNAQAAGASGVVIFNEGNTPERSGVLSGSLLDASGNPTIPTIPVAFTSFAIGQTLYNAYNAGTKPVMSLSIPAITRANAPDYNVIAESKGGDPNHVVVVDAHLDAIYGEGMLDNASGSATILDIAQQMKNVTPTNKLRFIWFGGEELGELGSHYYVSHLSSNDLSHIGYDLDADVTATPNYVVGVLDPTGPDLFSRVSSEQFPNRVYKASTVAENQAIGYFNSIGLNTEPFSPVGTDAEQFNLAGIAASGVLTGQDCCKTQNDVNLFGGTTGLFEGFGTPAGCVDNPFLWCDNLSNNDRNVLTFMSRGFAVMVVNMAFDTKVMSASNNAVYSKKLPITSEVDKHLFVS